MTDTAQEIFDAAKALLKLETDDEDTILEILAAETEVQIMAYCRLAVFPSQLVGLAALITADTYRRFGAFGSDAAKGLSTIKEGDSELTFTEFSNESFLTKWEERLKPFINRRGLVPSDLTKPEGE